MHRLPLAVTLSLLLSACGDVARHAAQPGGEVATQAVGADSSALRAAVSAAGIRPHLEAFQAIASANGGTRAAHLPGYAASLDYVKGRLDATGAYRTSVQPFTYTVGVDESTMFRVSPAPRPYALNTDFATMTFSVNGDVTAGVQAVDVVLPPGTVPSTSTSGCEAADFAGFVPGNIALLQRGTCTFAVKALNAQAAGAEAVIIFNEGTPGVPDRNTVVFGTLGAPGVTVPVVGASFPVGEELAMLAQNGGAFVRVQVVLRDEQRTSSNLIAESVAGRTDRVVVVGAHLDSVDEGPGINDNGSGSAMNLEIALQMARLGVTPRNQVRFAFWGAEELGLLGSAYYVSQLTTRQKADIALNLNFDMVASPNYVRFVYDGDGSSTPLAGPNGSGVIERVFLDHFASVGLAARPTEFSGRSDYGPFIEAGIPAGGLFTGAEGIKTAEEAAAFGGTAGVAYDPCYHQACDTLANINDAGLGEMSDAAAHAVLTFAQTTSAVNGTGRAAGSAVGKLAYRADRALR